MPSTENLGRRQCIPILYTRGTHYDVGFDMGRTFSSIIQNFLKSFKLLEDEYVPQYATPKGRRNYEETLAACKKYFPQYVRELEGIADGAKVPFEKLFLLHLDEIIAAGDDVNGRGLNENCSSIMINEDGHEIIAHNEDALSVTLNHFYLVSAHVVSESPQGKWGVREEKFTSLCYAGYLPGYTMSYNHHGLIFVVNTLCAKTLLPGKIPRYFLTRALLAAENFEQAQKILRDLGCGAAEGFSVNLTFLNQEGVRLFHNAEISPAYENNESGLNVLTISRGESSIHCNTYIRAKTEEIHPFLLPSTKARLCALKSYPPPKTKEDVLYMLGDQSGSEYTVFADLEPVHTIATENIPQGVYPNIPIPPHINLDVFRDEGKTRTIAVGVFDCIQRTWTLYADNPRVTQPLVVLHLDIKSQK